MDMKISNFLLFVLLFGFTISMTSCAKSIALKKYTVSKGAIPADFGKDHSILVVVLPGGPENRFLKKKVKRNYHGKYVFAKETEVDSRYSDIDKYRYVFTSEKGSSFTYNPSATSGSKFSNQVTNSSYFLVDRKSGKVYNAHHKSAAFAKLIDAYTTNLEKVRLKNQ